MLYKVDQGPVHQRFLMCLQHSNLDYILCGLGRGKRGAHMGIQRTYKAIRTKYYWPKVFTDVQTFIKHCDLCQRYKLSAFLSGLLQPIPVHILFHTVGLDIIGPLKGQLYRFLTPMELNETCGACFLCSAHHLCKISRLFLSWFFGK